MNGADFTTEAIRLAKESEERVLNVYGRSEDGAVLARLAQVYATLAESPAQSVIDAARALLDVLDGHQWNTPPDVDDARRALRLALQASGVRR